MIRRQVIQQEQQEMGKWSKVIFHIKINVLLLIKLWKDNFTSSHWNSNLNNEKIFFKNQINKKIFVIITSAGDNTETTPSRTGDENDYGQLQQTLWKILQ